MFRIISCLQDQHDLRLVALAGAVCFAATLVGTGLYHRALATESRTRMIWIAIAGCAIGYGIWATHFIAMLAYDPGMAIGYGLYLTAASLLTAMIVTSAGLCLATYNWTFRGTDIGGAVIGIGIAGMHLLGMYAIDVPGHIMWSYGFVATSIFLGCFFSTLALTFAARRVDVSGVFFAASLLSLAIISHHFTAMGAVELVPDPLHNSGVVYLPPNVLALAIAGVALSILGMSIVGLIADHRMAARTDALRTIIRQMHDAKSEAEISRRELEEQKIMLNTAIESMSQGLLLFDSAERLVICNQRYIQMYDLPVDLAASGCSFRELVQHRQRAGSFRGNIDEYHADLRHDLSQGRVTQTDIELPDGRLIRIANHPLPDGGWLAMHEDVTEQRRSNARIAYMAHHDELTGLFNRTAFVRKLNKAAARQRRYNNGFSVLLLDLDRFKHVNDTLGHAAGDAVLRDVAKRLLGCLRETDYLGRLGGDEFAIIQSDDDNQTDAAVSCARRVIELLSEPFSVYGNEVNIGTSIGIALAPRNATDPENLLKMADMALYRAKAGGRGRFQFYEPEMIEAARARREVETQLRRGIGNGELVLHYQPIVGTRSGRIDAFEALVRWRHPTKGTIPPDKFIPIAEETGLINEIGEWVLRTGCTEAANWPENIKIAINLSPVQFRKSNLCDIISSALDHSGLPPERLVLEITETALIDSGAAALKALRELKSRGIAIALDDFGTGYSSLSHLTMFPFDRIKIDKSFTAEVNTREDCTAIILATLALANGLKIETTAEGVESEVQCEFLRLAGVTSLQGYLFDRARPADEISFGPYRDRCDFSRSAVPEGIQKNIAKSVA